MALIVTVDSTDITDKVRLDSLRLEMSATQGEVGAGSIELDDTTGTADDIPITKEWSVTESDATPTTIAGGFVAERAIDKGPLAAGTQRQFKPVLEDWNTVLTDRVFGGGGANRPEETDYERVSWVLGGNKLGMLGGAGQVPNTNTVTMDPTDYRGKTPLDVLDDCAESANKNFYVYYDSGNTDWRLYYDKIASTEAAFTSSLQVSDDPSEVDSTSIFAPSAIDYVEDPERIYSGLLVKWANGWIFESDATTESTYRRLNKTVVKENKKKAKRAREWAERQLEKLDDPIKRLDLTVSVPGSALGELRAGMRIEVKIRSRGITAFTYFRIASVIISPRQGRLGVTDVEYDVRLKMVDRIRPVNLDDVYGGGDSSGNSGTGGGTGGNNNSGGGTTGDGGTGSSGDGSYVLDDFTRTSGDTLTVDAVSSAVSHAYGEGTTATVTLPTGWDDTLGRYVFCLVHVDDDTDLQAEMEANDFTAVPTVTDLFYRRITGGEPWGTGFDLLFDGAVEVGAVCLLLSGVYEELPDNPGLWFKAASSATADPASVSSPSGDGWDGEPAIAITTCRTDGSSITSGPSGYTEIGTTDDTNIDYRGDYKLLDAAAEDPSTYSASGVEQTYTYLIRGGGIVGWGSIPEGEGVDTEAPWEGGNAWEINVVSGSADVYISNGVGRADMTADGSQVSNRLEANAPDDPSDEPWGPWSSADAMYLMRWKVDPIGDTGDAAPNLLETQVLSGDWKATFRIHLGDAQTHPYQSGGDERGIVILQGSSPTASDFVSKTIATDTWYLTRMDFRGNRCRMKQWDESVSEPIAWDIDVAKEDETLSDVSWSYWRAYGNDGMDFYVDWIDAQLGSALGGAIITTLPPGDGSSTTWYVDPWVGGIIVFVDGIRTPPASVDRDAGTFTFDRAPADGAVIRAEYTPQ